MRILFVRNVETLSTLFTLWSEQKQCFRVVPLTQNSIRCLCSVDTLQNGLIGWRGGDQLLNKVIIFGFFAHKKNLCSFINLRLNPWCTMDYFNDVLAAFLHLDHINYIAVYGRVRELSEFIKISSFVFQRWTKVCRVWNDMMGSS